MKLSEDARKKADEEARLAEQERLKKEAEQRRLAEEARKKSDEENRLAQLEKQRKEAEDRKLAMEAQRKADEDARLAEQARIKKDLEAKAQADALAKEQAAKLAEENRLKSKQEQQRLADEAARIRDEARKKEEERIRLETERIREQEEKLRQKVLADQAKRQEELNQQAEARKRQTMVQLGINTGTPIPAEDVAAKYGSENTVEKIQLNKIYVTRTVFNREGVITFYAKVEHDNGSVYHFKNGEFITAWQYNHETK
jgi:hypothetical protein